MTDLRTAAQQALEALEDFKRRGHWGDFDNLTGALKAALVEDAMQKFTDVNQELEAALAEPVQQGCNHCNQPLYAAIKCRVCGRVTEPVQEPVAWSHNLIDNIITHRPADLERHPERWTALYSEPQPCPTCEALARTVMMDQTGHDLAPPQRKPLTEEEIRDLWSWAMTAEAERTATTQQHAFARAIERAHGIGS